MRRTSRRPAACAALTYSSTTETTSRGWNGWRSRADSIGIGCGSSSTGDRASAGPRVLVVGGGHDRLDAAAHGEVAGDDHAARADRRDQVVEDFVGDRFVEDAAIAEVV